MDCCHLPFWQKDLKLRTDSKSLLHLSQQLSLLGLELRNLPLEHQTAEERLLILGLRNSLAAILGNPLAAGTALVVAVASTWAPLQSFTVATAGNTAAISRAGHRMQGNSPSCCCRSTRD